MAVKAISLKKAGPCPAWIIPLAVNAAAWRSALELALVLSLPSFHPALSEAAIVPAINSDHMY